MTRPTLEHIREIASNNRGVLLDVFVFLANLFLMRELSVRFIELIQAASRDERLPQFVLFAMAAGMFVLPPLGATLKRWRFHERRFKGGDLSFGCLFNPIFYFCLTAVLFSTINAFVMQQVYGRKEPDGGVFVTSLLVGIVLMITHTWLVYRYFSAPKREPKFRFLMHPASELVGDACIWLNVLFFQLFWNLLALTPFERATEVGEVAGRLAIVAFLALLVYFPPRMFYLIDDIRKRRVWFTILLANSPLIYRVLAGNPSGPAW